MSNHYKNSKNIKNNRYEDYDGYENYEKYEEYKIKDRNKSNKGKNKGKRKEKYKWSGVELKTVYKDIEGFISFIRYFDIDKITKENIVFYGERIDYDIYDIQFNVSYEYNSIKESIDFNCLYDGKKDKYHLKDIIVFDNTEGRLDIIEEYDMRYYQTIYNDYDTLSERDNKFNKKLRDILMSGIEKSDIIYKRLSDIIDLKSRINKADVVSINGDKAIIDKNDD